jgi:hypothetical protein
MRVIATAILVASSLLLVWVPAQAESLSARFNASVSYGSEGPLLDFTGSVLVSGARMRVELTQALTEEPMIVLLDYDASTLTLLFPDTLNGERYSLEDFDSIGGFPRVRDALDGSVPTMPDGWKQESHGTAQLDGRQCKHFSAQSEDGLAVEWWTRADNRPVKVIGQAGDIALTIYIDDYDADAAAAAADFEVPEGYTISEPETDMPDQLPDLGRTI